ncbi:MAG: type II/IV secretion system ATPase subunit [Halosimplex sp.]
MSSDRASSSNTSGALDESGAEGRSAAVGEYTWEDFMREFGYENELSDAVRDVETGDAGSSGVRGLFDRGSGTEPRTRREYDWGATDFDPVSYLGFSADRTRSVLEERAGVAKGVRDLFERQVTATPVTKGDYTWEHFKWEYYYDEDGSPPRDSDGEPIPFEPEEYLGFEPEETEDRFATASEHASRVRAIVDQRTVNVNPELDEDEFFSTVEGYTTITNRYDLEKTVPAEKKLFFTEVERYWVNKPFAFIVVFHSHKENEKRYYIVDPYLDEIESDLAEFLAGKLRTTIKYSGDEMGIEGTDDDRREIVERETNRLLEKYDLHDRSASEHGVVTQLKYVLGRNETQTVGSSGQLDGIAARPEPAVLEDDPGTLTEYQVEKLLYRLKRDFLGYERIDPVKHDINVEDISCDGYNSRVFVYHTEYENIITNVEHGQQSLDDFVVKLAQRSGKGISKRQPQVDATLPDGSRAQLTLGEEVSDHGTNYTIRQFKDVPFTPVDLINWNTFSLDEMAFLWLCIENNKSLIFAGGTASGKTTSLNAVSLFIPSNAKIVSIEDTREVELPQRNWVASVTRPSFGEDDTGDVDEFDLLEAALRQRPDYIVMGEVRGEEGRVLFQVMSTGHTTYTTFHADSVGEVLKRFTTDPINVSKTLFTALDLVSIQTQTNVQGQKVRRNKTLTEINEYDAENDEISVQDVFRWQPEDDEFLEMSRSKKLQEVKFDRGWTQEKLETELFKRRLVLSYLISHGLNDYAQVAATVQAFMNDPDAVLALIADDQLEVALDDLRGMESVIIDTDPEKEAMVPRPDPGSAALETCDAVLAEADERLLDEYRGQETGTLVSALPAAADTDGVGLDADDGDRLLASVAVDETGQLQVFDEAGNGSPVAPALPDGSGEPSVETGGSNGPAAEPDGGDENATATDGDRERR